MEHVLCLLKQNHTDLTAWLSEARVDQTNSLASGKLVFILKKIKIGSSVQGKQESE